MSKFYAALEIGTTRTVLAIGEPLAQDRLRITHAEIPSTGVRKSQILDLGQATQSVRSVLHAIEKRQSETGSKVNINNAFLVVSGQHVRADPYAGSVQISAVVKDDDIVKVIDDSRRMELAPDREFLDIADQDYILDNLGGIPSPKGMAGRILKHNTLQIHADHARLDDARTAAGGAHLEIRDPLFAVTCAGDAVTSEIERQKGVVVLDLGGGSTGYAVYSDGFLVSTGVIGVGGDHITNDIANAFQTTNAQAEALKIGEASALIGGGETGAASRVRVVQSDSALMDSRTISRCALNTVVNARLMELASIIRETLEGQDLLHRIGSGIVLTGGGAQMKGIANIFQDVLEVSVRIGVPQGVEGLDDVDSPASFASIAGALLYARNNYPDDSILNKIRDIFK